MWNNTRYLIAQEYSRLRFAYIFCVLFVLFYGWMVSQMAVAIVEPRSDTSSFVLAFNVIALDMFFLMVVPTVSFLLQRKMTGIYWKTDFYSQNLLYFRRFPIHTKEIVYSRMLRHVVNAIVLLALFFTVFGMAYNAASEKDLSFSSWMVFSLIWIGFGLGIGSLYVYCENLMSGKRYFVLSLLVIGFTIIIMIPFYLSTGLSLVHSTLQLATSSFHMLWAVLAMGLAIGFIVFISRRLVKKLQARDFC